MASTALKAWQSIRAKHLGQLYDAHAKTEGENAPGRRYATTQLNNALIIAVSAQFQGYCRALHDEASLVLVEEAPVSVKATFLLALQRDRKLDRGNPNEGNIGSDFGRLGLLKLWDRGRLSSASGKKHRVWLRRMNLWRNAIAHQDFDFSSEDIKLLIRGQPWLSDVRRCHRACDYLAEAMDDAVSEFLKPLHAGVRPW